MSSGKGRWDEDKYASAKRDRTASGTDDFAYSKTATKTHSNLDPARINSKPFGKLESCDSAEYPESNAVLVSLDVTGSNKARAYDAQQALPKLMKLLGTYLSDPQVAFAANDDFNYVSNAAVQISDFEVDNKIDEHLRSIRLIGQGGGNSGESYDLILYAAARKTKLDCFDKRGRKGYLFLYADEPIFAQVKAHEVRSVFGDTLQENIPIAEIIEEARRLYNVFVIWPVGGYDEARAQFLTLFGGEEYVLDLQHPNLICELIGATIGVYEKDIAPDVAVHDLVLAGTSSDAANSISTALVKVRGGQASGELARSAGAAAARL